LRRDPYAIYAERILRLKPLDPIGAEAGARESGILLHDVLAQFTLAHPKGALPADATTGLLNAAREAFAELMKNAEFRAFVWPRHVNALTKFVDWEQQRRTEIVEILPEQSGTLVIPLEDGSTFKLSGVADRIDRLRDGSLDVLDYKSGRVPTPKEIKAGFAPQLPLEAAMVARGAFDLPKQPVESATYLKLGGSKGFVYTPVKAPDEMSFRELSDEQYAGLLVLLNQFRKESTAYLPRPYPQFINEWGTYDHLARVREWSSTGSAE
jgi:ATP-dependent helicase/nuclease subunit B